MKYLGILVDSTLSWKPQITELSKKTCKDYWCVFQNKTPCPLWYTKALILLSFLLFYFILFYWLNPPNHLGLSIHIAKESCQSHSIQDRYARSYYSFILQIENAKTIWYALKLPLICVWCQKNQSIQPFDDFFTPLHSVHNYNTRQKSKGGIVMYKSWIHLHSPAFSCTHLHSPETTCTHLVNSPAFSCTHLHSPALTCIHLKPPAFTWNHLHSPREFTCIQLHSPACTCTHLHSPETTRTQMETRLAGHLLRMLYSLISCLCESWMWLLVQITVSIFEINSGHIDT